LRSGGDYPLRKEDNMANKSPASPLKPGTAKMDDGCPGIKPLTRRGYRRLAATEKQIAGAIALDRAGLIARAQWRDETASDYLSPEALVYFIRRADSNRDVRVRDALFRELVERCAPFFRGQFPGMDKTVREDLQQDVLNKVVEDILAVDDRADFMEVRFWSYLKRKTISAYRSISLHAEEVESLDTGYSGAGESEGRTKLESLRDERLSPEQLTMVLEGLGKLPPRLRKVFIMRHAVGMAVGSDNRADDPPGKPTLAQHFGCSGRTIRNWLREADDLLASLREKEDDAAK
jgi:DNA-directed RNA polymerase specialized sigma24 family protein